jgi:hypothetical protein
VKRIRSPSSSITPAAAARSSRAPTCSGSGLAPVSAVSVGSERSAAVSRTCLTVLGRRSSRARTSSSSVRGIGNGSPGRSVVSPSNKRRAISSA